MGAILLFVRIPVSYAQDSEPRAHTKLPAGLNFIVAGCSCMDGTVAFDPAVPPDNANMKIKGTLFACASNLYWVR